MTTNCSQAAVIAHMRTLAIAWLSLALSACAATAPPNSGYKSAKALWEQSEERPEYGNYGAAFTESQNEQRLDEDSGCYESGRGQKVVLVLIVNSDGVVSEAYADRATEQADCFKAAYLGAKMPVPPFSPFPMLMQMN
jgi:hypothetical protein